jgi:hypothetical protein
VMQGVVFNDDGYGNAARIPLLREGGVDAT